ncbi:hypothetical protein DL93DRAFT_2076397 [Clavulina sp. PMI_390]|nr:hypothetical protein DL93DRAFT_2076397 [Clavulina sp. PMI_390]
MMQFMRYEAGPPEIIQDMENAGEEKDTIDSKKEGPTERTEITPPAADLNDTPVFNRPLGPTIGELIKPWFLSSTYRFGPRNLSRVFVALHATLLSPALALGIFGYQCAASAVRVRGHLKQKEMETASAELPEPQDETRGRPIPKRSLTIEEFGPGSPILLTLEGPEATAVDDVVKFMDNQGLMTLLSIPAPQEASSDTASVKSGSSSAQERADTPSTLVAPLEIPSPQSPTQHLAPPTPLKRTSSKSSLRSILRSMSPKRREEASERTLVRTTSSSSSASSSSSSSAASSCSPGSNLLSTCKARLSSVSLPASPFKTVLRNSNDQEQMIAMIRSALGPKLRVHLGFIPNVWNSHAVIVCQFPGEKGLEYHEEGRSIIQHWADHFSLI